MRVAAGPRGTRINVPVDRAPAQGDSIHVVTNTGHLGAVLILPDGRRITETSPESGFQWRQAPNQKPLGSDDGGDWIEITFTKPAAAGAYAIQFTSAAVERGALAQVWFTSRMQEFETLVQSMPGAQIVHPLPLSSGVPARIDVRTAIDKAMLDIVVPNPSIEVTLTLPSGETVRHEDAKAVGLEWSVENVLSDEKSALGLLGGILLPVKGTHHLIGLPKAAPGTYLIRGKPAAGTTGQLQAALLPFEAAAKSLDQKLYPPSQGGVAMQLSEPISEHFVGEQVELTVRLIGAVAGQPPEFRVRTETQPYLETAPSPQARGRRLGPAGAVETVPVAFHKDSAGAYRGLITLRHPGWTRVAVRAKGTNAGGRPFELEEVTSIPTNEIVARVLEMRAEGKDENGDGKFDSLDVALDVDVIIPGSYMVSANVSNGAKEAGPGVVTTKQLEKGRQRITVALPAGQIWNRMRSGPLDVQASLTLVLAVGSYIGVPGKESLRRQLEYRREQWDSGAYHSEDVVTAHGIRPAGSGRYTIAEIEWEASTPGGQCAWTGELTDGHHSHLLSDQNFQTVPAGQRKFSFLFDGAAIASGATRDWIFEASAACGDRKDWAKFPATRLDLNSDDYQVSQGALELDGQVTLSQTAPAARYWQTGLTAKGTGAESAQFEITKLPEGWNANVHPILKGRDTSSVNLLVQPPPDASPARYFIEVTVTAGAQQVSREFVVELIESDR